MRKPLTRHEFLGALTRACYRLKRRVFNRGSYSLNCLDKSIIDILLPTKNRGYYVELGANDGLRQSNTYLLQSRYGWNGLLIEPSPAKFVQLVSNRSFGCLPNFQCAACVDNAYGQHFVEMEYSDLMSVAHGLQLDRSEVLLHVEKGSSFLPNPAMRHRFGAVARTLTTLLDEVGAPFDLDLLSLDVEGNELTVLHGLDFSRYRPRWILAECRDDSVPHFLVCSGYRLDRVLSDSGTYRDMLFCSI